MVRLASFISTEACELGQLADLYSIANRKSRSNFNRVSARRFVFLSICFVARSGEILSPQLWLFGITLAKCVTLTFQT